MKWSKYVWLALTIAVVGFEIFCDRTGRPTLTDVTIAHMPWQLIMPFLGWLFLHFGINYAQGSHFFLKFFGG